MARGLADHVQLPLERVGHDDVLAAADKNLADQRLAGLDGGGNGHRVVDRHVAPAEYDLAFQLYGALQFLFARETRRMFLRQEHHADAVFAFRRQRHALLCHFLAIEAVRQLDQDARAVTHQRIGADGAPMVEILKNLQTLLDDLVAFLALDVGNEADATGIVLVGWVIHALCGGNRTGNRLLVIVHEDTVL